MKIPHNACILVGDGEKALLLRNEGDEAHLNLVTERMLEADHATIHGIRPDGDEGFSLTDAAAAHPPYLKIEKARFARDVADRLYRLAHAGRYQHLVVVAPPTTLGNLRDALHKEVRAKLIGEVDKDLVNHPVYRIEEALAALPPAA